MRGGRRTVRLGRARRVAAALAACASIALAGPRPAAADPPRVSIGAGATGVAGRFEQSDVARAAWPVAPGGHLALRVDFPSLLFAGLSFDALGRRIDTRGLEPPPAQDPGRVVTSMPMAFVGGNLEPFARGGSLRVAFGLGAALDRRREAFRLPRTLAPDGASDRVPSGRATAFAGSMTLAYAARVGERAELAVEAGYLGLFYPRNPTWARPSGQDGAFGAVNAQGFRPYPTSPRRPLALDGERHAFVLRLTALVRLGR